MFTEAELNNLPCKPLSGFDTACYRIFEIDPLEENKCYTCHTVKEKLLVCGNCGAVKYCSKECQRKDWKEHKVGCSDVHGVTWLLRNFANYDKETFDEALKSGRVNGDIQDLRDGKDMRGCASTCQLLALYLTDVRSGYHKAFEDLAHTYYSPKINDLEEDIPEVLMKTLMQQPRLKSRRNIPTSLIYSCILTAFTPKGNFVHFFTITQYGTCNTDPTYRLWQAYSKGPDKLVYSLDNWFDLSFEIPGVNSLLRKEMSEEIFLKRFLKPFCVMLSDFSSLRDKPRIWLSLFGSNDFSECEGMDLYFIAGNAYRYKPHSKVK